MTAARHGRGARAAAVLVAVAAAPGCGGGAAGPPEADAQRVAVSARAGTVAGVGIGDFPAEVERVFGRPGSTTGYMPVGERFTGPETITGSGAVHRYEHFAFLSDSKVFSLMTTAPGAETEAGVGVGDSLDDIGRAYPGAECGSYDYGPGSGYSWCRTRVGQHDVFFGGDPVRSITVTVASAVGPSPPD